MSPDEQPVITQGESPAEADARLAAGTPDPVVAATLDQPTSIDDVSPEPPNADELLAEEEEAPPPSTVHPAAAAGTTPEDKALAAGRDEYGEYFIGMWGEHPNFGCPYCAYAVLDRNGEVELHVLSMIETGNLAHMAALQLKGA